MSSFLRSLRDALRTAFLWFYARATGYNLAEFVEDETE